MSQYDELKRAASEAKNWGGEVGEGRWYTAECFKRPYFSIPDAEFIAACEPGAVLALIAENDRLREDPGMRAIRSLRGDCADLMAERDQLRAEVACLRTGHEAYEQVNAELKAENETLVAAGQALRDEWRKDQADAERYRWLIRNAEEIYFQGRHLHLDPYYVGQEKIKEDADSEIDAALGQGEQP